MDDTLPRVLYLLLAGAVVALGLRGHVKPRVHLAIMIFLAVVAVVAIGLVLSGYGRPKITPSPDAPTTTAALRPAVSFAAVHAGYMDTVVAEV